MGKLTGGGGSTNFELNIVGDGSVGSSFYHELGVIPNGQRILFGSLQATSPDKSITFEVRTSNSGQSAGDDASTTVLASASVSPRKGTVLLDMYKRGRLHLVSVIGSGTEKFWIRLKSKGAAGSYLFVLNYTLE